MVRGVVLDFDGVVLDSVGVKTNAFANLFADKGPAIVQQVVDHHLAHGGISRFRKFEHIYNNILGISLSVAESNRLGERFSELAFQEILRAPCIPGAMEFLREGRERYKLFVASGTPHEELLEIIRLRELQDFFVAAFGSPAGKAEILRNIATMNGWEESELVFVGDAITDFQAANEVKVRFIGIAQDLSSPFPTGTKILPDLRNLVRAIEERTA